MAFSFVHSHMLMGDAGWFLLGGGGVCQLGPQGPVSMSKPAALLGLNTSPEGDDLCGGFFGVCWSMQLLPAPSLWLEEAPWGSGGCPGVSHPSIQGLGGEG